VGTIAAEAKAVRTGKTIAWHGSDEIMIPILNPAARAIGFADEVKFRDFHARLTDVITRSAVSGIPVDSPHLHLCEEASYAASELIGVMKDFGFSLVK
jgi:hypothetical protein